MKIWKKISNGHTLTITFDDKAAIKSVEDQIKEIQNAADEDFEEVYCYTEVYSDIDKYVPKAVCIADLEELIERIKSIAADEEGLFLWNSIALKKNGTFRRNSKHTFFEQKFGNYWEDSYGWYTQILRHEPITDTEGVIKLDHVVLHY